MSKEFTADELRAKSAELMDMLGVHTVTASMLRYAADVVERCDKAVESMHTQLMHLANEGKTAVDVGKLSKYFAHLENILRGDAGKEEEK